MTSMKFSHRSERCIKVIFTMRAPIFSHGTSVLGFGMDAAALVQGDKQALPGSLIKGNLRDVLTLFADNLRDSNVELSKSLSNRICQWFGKEASAQNEANSGVLNFGYYWLSEQSITQGQKRNRVQIDDDTGSVQAGSLQVLESPFVSGDEIDFVGQLRFIASDDEFDEVCHWLNKSCAYIDALGAFKSVGFGQVTKFAIETAPNHPVPAQNGANIRSRRLQVRLKFDRPICIAKPHLAQGNLFHTTEHVPGNVLKGAIAEQAALQLGDRSALNDWTSQAGFDNWVMTHALPVAAGGSQRPIARPKSLFINGKSQVLDATNLIEASNINHATKAIEAGLLAQSGAVAFESDWKGEHYAKVEKLINPAAVELIKTTKVSTAIESIYREGGSGQSKESALFAREELQTTDIEFLCDLDLSSLSEEQFDFSIQALNALQQSTLIGLGKTKACASVTLTPAASNNEWFIELQRQLQGGHLILTLQSMANLFDPAPEGNPTQEHLALYQRYFDSLGAEGLTLEYAFATQTLRGGEHLNRRFSGFSMPDYAPCWLTEEGSVFGFSIAEQANHDELVTIIAEWLRYGLPLAGSQVSDPINRDWQRTPYINRNGFGEVRLGTGFETLQGAKA